MCSGRINGKFLADESKEKPLINPKSDTRELVKVANKRQVLLENAFRWNFPSTGQESIGMIQETIDPLIYCKYSNMNLSDNRFPLHKISTLIIAFNPPNHVHTNGPIGP
jgi:hypothetical protein